MDRYDPRESIFRLYSLLRSCRSEYNNVFSLLCLSGPPASLLVANLVDVRQINPGGSGNQILLEEPKGAIIALDYDPVENKVLLVSF